MWMLADAVQCAFDIRLVTGSAVDSVRRLCSGRPGEAALGRVGVIEFAAIAGGVVRLVFALLPVLAITARARGRRGWRCRRR